MAIPRTQPFQKIDFDTLVCRVSALLDVPTQEILSHFRGLKPRIVERNGQKGWQHIDAMATGRNVLRRLPLTLEVSPIPTVNEVYEKWYRANENERTAIEPEVYKAVLRYARAVLCGMFGEYDPQLASSAANDVLMQLPQFEGRCKFSTYVFGVLKKKVVENKRRIGRYKKHFVPEADCEEALEKYPVLGSEADAKLLRRDLLKGLNVKEKHLLDLMSENRTPAEIAHSLKIGKKTCETRIRRLRTKLKRKLKETRRARQPID